MAIVRYKRKPGDPLTRRQKENLKRIAEILRRKAPEKAP